MRKTGNNWAWNGKASSVFPIPSLTLKASNPSNLLILLKPSVIVTSIGIAGLNNEFENLTMIESKMPSREIVLSRLGIV